MAASASRTVRASSSSRNAPHLYLVLRVHLDAVAARLRVIGFHGWLRPSWIVGAAGAVCHVAIEVDPQSDTLIDDERRAAREVRETLILLGFIVGGEASAEPRPLRVSSYHGATVYAPDPARCPECTGGACLSHDVLVSDLREPYEAPRDRPPLRARRIVALTAGRAA